jgi:hypothetical protein
MNDWHLYDLSLVLIVVLWFGRMIWEEMMDKPARLLDGMPYIPSVKTNVQNTWRRFGWKPPSEQPKKDETKETQKS